MLLAGLSATPAYAVSPQTLQAIFGQLYGQNRQFAVLVPNDVADNELAPSPLVPDAPTSALRFNYESFQGVATGHSEAQLALYATPFATNYRQNFGRSITAVTVYTRLAPCGYCAVSLLTMLKNNGWTGSLYYYEQWTNMTDTQVYNSLKVLVGAGWSVQRVCPAIEACWTFQRKLRDLMMTTTPICKFCDPAAKKSMINNFINQGMESGASRSGASWRTYAESVLQLGSGPGAPAARAELINAIVQCAVTSSAYPVGLPVNG
jgi:hypothetical protein